MTRNAALAVAVALLLLAGCRATSRSQTTRSAAVPPRFARIESTLRRGTERAYAGDAAAVRALRDPVANEGLELIKARIPHDLRRSDVPRFLSARAYFGEALKQFVGAVDGGTDQAVFDAVRALYDATRGWISAYQGLPTETAV